MIDPIVLEFDVGVPPARAFAAWTERCSVWWPKSHTMSDGEFDVVFEPFVGGRVYELDADGTEYEWGEVKVWDPPHRVEYLWHIFLERERATTVSVTFLDVADGTSVRLVNDGFDVFGSTAGERTPRVGIAWKTITTEFKNAI